MKTFRVPFALLLTVVSGQAQDAVPDPAVSPAPAVSVVRTPQELEQLVAPIALYPDPLIALILPATTAPADVVLAARHMRDFPNDRSQIEHRAWDESVKSLTHYPEVLMWMDENLLWTKQLGEAFTEQPAEVMQAVQRLRAQARAAGTLVDTPQQQVLAEPQVIRIVPAQPDVIYVPHYEPEIVFVDRPVYHTRSFISFGVGVPVGSWLAYDCDWRRHTIWAGNRHRHWTKHDWRRPLVPFAHVSAGPSRAPIARQWRPTPPPPRPSAQVVATWRGHTPVARPSAFGTSATRSFAPHSSAPDHRRTGANTLPVANALPMTKPLPHTFAPGSARDLPGPRVQRQPTVVAPAPAQAPQPATPPVASVTTTPPSSRGSHPNWTRGGESRARTHQPAVANSTPLPVVPAMPMASSAPPVHQRVGPTAPSQTRTYSRSAPPHAVVPTLPMAGTPTRSRGVTGPVAPAATPQPSSAPAAAATAQSSPPQAAPAPSRPDSGRHSRRDRER